jgi:hypothetical protein
MRGFSFPAAWPVSMAVVATSADSQDRFTIVRLVFFQSFETIAETENRRMPWW